MTSSRVRQKPSRFLRDKADYFMSLASYLAASSSILIHRREPVFHEFPPNEEVFQHFHKDVRRAWNTFIHDKTRFKEIMSDFPNNGLDRLSRIQLDRADAFVEMIKCCFCLVTLYIFYSEYEGLEKKVKEIQHLNYLGDRLKEKAYLLIGFWISKLERIEATKPGSKARTDEMEERIQKVRERVEEYGDHTENGLEVSKADWIQIFEAVFDYPGVSYPTTKKYRDEIEKQLSEEIGKEVKIIFTE